MVERRINRIFAAAKINLHPHEVHMKPTPFLRSFLAITGSSLLAISYSHAATKYWDGDTVNGGNPAANCCVSVSERTHTTTASCGGGQDRPGTRGRHHGGPGRP